MKNLISISIFVLIITYLSGCASVGKMFRYQSRNELVIGKTTSKEAILLIGNTTQKVTISNIKGNYQILKYVYAHANPSGSAARILFLEFKNDTLNGKIYNSGFSDDMTKFNIEESKNVKLGVSTKEDVLKLLGETYCKAICPSTLGDFAKGCESAYEMWAWIYTAKSEGYDMKTIKSKTLRISFNDKGIVTDLETIQD